ncbi:tetratricopeptide repeat protein [Flavisolibacter tropicus]|uniref:Tetratricopeptide domain protein n=1 Tax=Flavisolibacter tropicus TaxID=1492898 RepID=A0A172TYX0_9BACT|nr:tetratricopeptide repeat protein [Flavisolibacter tropicus]ANE52182.1 tetratricopeptide domain protein [Flavisolibacter tropicus]
MKKLFFLLAVAAALQVEAQEQTAQETARTFMRSGDFDNAILVLNRALQSEPKNLELQKELIMAYYYKRDYVKALEGVKVIMEYDSLDVVSYQIAGNVYKALEEVKLADKMYKKALKQYPKSGALYSEYGELLTATQNKDAIKYWEKGIQEDPSFAGNYYNAALYYSNAGDKVWPLVYGEIFVNMESLTERATAMKGLLLENYKKLFANSEIVKEGDKLKNDFSKAFLQTMDKQSPMANHGITTETLTMIRTRFILEWYKTYGTKFPFRLFDYQQQLIREGMFEAYNQWLFGTVENLPAYENWTKTHSEAYNKFTSFQKGRIFKMPAGQYYQSL